MAHKTGTTAQNYNDAGIIYQNGEPLFILTAYTDRVPAELPDGTPGHTAANELIGRLCRVCYDTLCVQAAVGSRAR